jgi:dolichol-phosphate mannosyltransferase
VRTEAGKRVERVMKIGAIIPVYDEETRIGGVLEKFEPGVVAAVLAVNDGSTDGTADILERAGVVTITHDRRMGVGAAIRDGLRHLQSLKFDIAVVLAGNGKDDPREIPLLVAPILAGEADYVQGSRFLAGGSFTNLPLARYAMIKGYTAVWFIAARRKLSDVTNGFRAYRLSILDDSRIDLDQDWLNRYELEYYLHYKVLSLGYKFTEVAVSKNYPSRKKYSKIRPFADWWSIVKPILVLRLGIKS